jgi:DNA-binding NarL/FixJ family response regulator
MTSANHSTISVLVCHSNPLIACGVASALREQEDFEVFVESRLGDVLHGCASATDVDVLIADHQLAIDTARAQRDGENRQRGRPPRIMVLSSNDGEWRVRSALDAGVFGYVVTSRPLHEIVEGIRALHRGARYLCPLAAARMAESCMSQQLTPRESEVLQVLGAGVSNKIIAKQLDMEVGTVKSHLRSMMSKLNAHNRTEIVAIALTRGLIPRGGPQAREAARAAARPESSNLRLGSVAELTA